jgi:hypothetical protein
MRITIAAHIQPRWTLPTEHLDGCRKAPSPVAVPDDRSERLGELARGA